MLRLIKRGIYKSMEVAAIPKGKSKDHLVCSSMSANFTQEKIAKRLSLFEKLYNQQLESLKKRENKPITITLPDGKTTEGVSNQTTPMDIAMKISKKLAERCAVAKVAYAKKDEDKGSEVVDVDAEAEGQPASKDLIVDLREPLTGDCKLTLLTLDDPIGRRTFYHSSAHLLGKAMEKTFQAYLCHGPPIDQGFFYDAFTGGVSISQDNYEKIEKEAAELISQNAQFQRLLLSKKDALELFADNPFKQVLIKEKISDNAITSAYRCGEFVDLCTGPHVPSTGMIKAFKVMKNSSSYWKGKQDLDDLQRVYGVSFQTQKELDAHLKMLEELAEKDHHNIGKKQKLFIFSDLAPGCAFFLPHGTRLFNKLVDFMRKQYHFRGFTEVNTPNMFKSTLWKTSGHYFKYKGNMFFLDVEEQEFGLKPMNCPSHCVMFNSSLRSYRDLPIRYADFGVLHRNEASGALHGLTRVRKFHQDDAHIFISEDQIEDEISEQLNFLRYVYDLIGFKYNFELSTRPEQFLGEIETWDKAETALKNVLNKNVKEWKLNPGDGAYYGPKIDVKITDCYNRPHQLGTIQLDFVQPLRFNLQYQYIQEKKKEESEGEEETKDEHKKPKKEKAEKAEKAEKKKKGDKKEKAEAKEEDHPKDKKEEHHKEEKKDEKKEDHSKDKKEEHKNDEKKADDKAKKPEEKKQEHPDHDHSKAKEHEEKKEEKKPMTLAEEEVFYAQIGKLKPGFKRPIIVHRAILGSLERCIAILCEHLGGKWPFWLNPRQIAVLPISEKHNDYAAKVRNRCLLEGYDTDLDISNETIKRKIREAQLDQYSFILVVGSKEEQNGSVNVRERDHPDDHKEMSMKEFLKQLKKLTPPVSEFQKKVINDAVFGKDEENEILNKFGTNIEELKEFELELEKKEFFEEKAAGPKDHQLYKRLKYIDFEAIGLKNLAKWKSSFK